MTDLVLAYWDFWRTAVPYSGGYLPVFPEQTVPTGTDLPYLTYSLTRNDAFEQTIDTVRVWSRSTNIQQLSGFLDSVAEIVPHGGVVLDIPGKGSLWLMRGTPFIQRQPSDETDIQTWYVNIIVRSYIL